MRTRSYSKNNSGFTLVELLVVMVLLAVVSGIVTTIVVTTLQSASATTARVTALNELERAMQQMTRDLRTAEAFLMTDTTDFSNEVTVTVYRGGAETNITYEVQTVDGNQALVRGDTGRTLVTLIDNDAAGVFTYLDGLGRSIPCSGASECATANQLAQQVEIRMVREIDGRAPVILESRVNVRNTRYEGGGI